MTPPVPSDEQIAIAMAFSADVAETVRKGESLAWCRDLNAEQARAIAATALWQAWVIDRLRDKVQGSGDGA